LCSIDSKHNRGSHFNNTSRNNIEWFHFYWGWIINPSWGYLVRFRKGSSLYPSICIYNLSYPLRNRTKIIITKKINPFHLVEKRPWPILASVRSLSITLSIIVLIFTNVKSITILSLFIALFISYRWWEDIYRESSLLGEHPKKVAKGLKTGIVLFITSEVFFFISFFWSFFHRSIAPNIEIGQIWPPKTIEVFDPIRIPLLNTILLLSSGISITWAHHEIIKEKLRNFKISMVRTVLLGGVFTILQAVEYINAPFCVSDSVFGTTFFVITGFHGIHVIIGTTFLVVTLTRIHLITNSSIHFLRFEISAWYWHFVDVVWLFLYITIYWWGI